MNYNSCAVNLLLLLVNVILLLSGKVNVILLLQLIFVLDGALHDVLVLCRLPSRCMQLVHRMVVLLDVWLLIALFVSQF